MPLPETRPAPEHLLDALSRERLVEVGRALGVAVPGTAKKDRQVEVLLGERPEFSRLLDLLHRDELKAACRATGVDDSGRARGELVRRLLLARGEEGGVALRSGAAPEGEDGIPRPGDVVRVRHREYLVERVLAPEVGRSGPAVSAHRVRLVGLDDDAQGRPLEVLWELELGARRLDPERQGLGIPRALDPPGRFGAYLATLRWHGVTATDGRLLQAPFRAGIKIKTHQLVPLERALELPRANLFIADDVGLGKTIEAGLILEELRLRQRVNLVLVACPAAICRQWQDELWKRFGLWFEIMGRDLIARRRQERGYGVNPWATHDRFIVSHALLRRPEIRDPLLHHLGERAGKSLLILDEAHVAAPAGAGRYAVDSQITTVLRDVAPRFENRLFLSATPHNGHSNSFSALLEILDPQRFLRGVPVTPAQRDRVMVRRLKSDLEEIGCETFPRRHVVRLELRSQAGAWSAAAFDSASPEAPPEDSSLGAAEPFEIDLAERLLAYSALLPAGRRGRLIRVRLQQRLLSSVEAFHRTLRVHARHVAAEEAEDLAPPGLFEPEDLADLSDDPDDEDLAARDDAAVAEASKSAGSPLAESRTALDELLRRAALARDLPDAKARYLVAWIAQNLCPAVRLGGAADDASREARRWSDRRVIVFTEFVDTLNYLKRLLETAFDRTDRGEERILLFRGGLDDARRDEIQRAWNAPPGENPVRILLATDAAREGVNLQGACHDLFHYDVPWNPARLEQRNGRIDRTLQPERDVYCRYFVYRERPEDRVLDALVRKVEVIRREVGSLGTVLLDQIEKALENGLDESAFPENASAAGAFPGRAGLQPGIFEAPTEGTEGKALASRATVTAELEGARERKNLERQIDRVGKLLDRSRAESGFAPDLLRRALDEALALEGRAPLSPLDPAASGAYRLPPLPESWAGTLDALRPPRGREESLSEWRRRPPRPVVFEAPDRMTEEAVHLHLEHPLVARLLSRFRDPGFAAERLGRVTALVDQESARLHAVAFGRLSLFGAGATRLHDRLVAVAVALPELAEGATPPAAVAFEPLSEGDEKRLVERLWRRLETASSLEEIPAGACARLLAAAAPTFAALWKEIEQEADGLAHQAEDQLAARGRREAEELRALLVEQRAAAERGLSPQMRIEFSASEVHERRQWENDRHHLETRLAAIDREIEREPRDLEDLYRIQLRRLSPVGLVYFWPAGR